MYVCRIGFALDDIEDANVAAGFAGDNRNHAVLGLQQTAHDVQDCGFPNCFRLFDIVAREGCVGCDQEMAAWGRNERGGDPHEIIVHVAGVAEGGRRSRHDS